jgi:hypothetical protein
MIDMCHNFNNDNYYEYFLEIVMDYMNLGTYLVLINKYIRLF